MNNYRTFLGLPPLSLNLLSTGLSVTLVCLGIRIARASDIALKVANTQLITGNSARRLEQLANELETQAKIIQQKDIAYQELSEVYQTSLKGKRGYERLQDKIEKVESLPEVESVIEIKQEISATEEILLDTLVE